MTTPSMSVALAVDDVARASRFYQRLGFLEEITIPSERGGLASFRAIVRFISSQLLLPVWAPDPSEGGW